MKKSFNPIDRKAPRSRRSGFLEKAMGKRLSFLVIVAGLILSAQPIESQESPIAGRDAYRAFLRTFYGRLQRLPGLLLPSKLTFLADGGGDGGGGGGGSGGGTGDGTGDGGNGNGTAGNGSTDGNGNGSPGDQGQGPGNSDPATTVTRQQ